MIRRAAPLAGLMVTAAVALAACAAPAPTAWQTTVETVAAQASGGDYTSALASLAALEAEVVARRDSGELSTEEADAILARIATVRSDLTALVPTPTPTPTPEPVQTSDPAPQDTPTVSTDDDTSDDEQDAGPGDKNSDGGSSDRGPGENGNGQGKGKESGGPGSGTGPGKKDG